MLFVKIQKLANENKKCWQGTIKQLQRKLNINLDETSNKVSSSKLHDYFVNKTFDELKNINNTQCGKLSFYSTLFNYDDKKFEIQPYLCFPLHRNLYSYLTKLRISAHQLYIETGRYCIPVIPRESKFCYHCKTIVEDEKHFLLECPLYKHIRKKYSKISYVNPISLLNPVHVVNTKEICLYIRDSLYFRNNTLLQLHNTL